MLLIVDGYNVVKQVWGPNATEREKHIFIKKLIHYVDEKNHEAILVFDGGYSLHRSHERRGNVTIVYVGMHQSADDYIQEIIAAGKKELLLVSSDNQLCSYASSHGIASIEALTFFKVVYEKKEAKMIKSRHQDVRKFSTQASQEVDEIMEEESQKIPLKKEEIAPVRVRGNSLKKHERALLKKIKKL